MALEDSVNTLVAQTTALLNAVNVSKQTLDNTRAASEVAATAAGSSKNAAEAARNNALLYASQAETFKQAAESARDDAVAVVYSGDASLTPAAGKIPVARAGGTIDEGWIRPGLNALLDNAFAPLNTIGVPGDAGFGVGVCPTLPDGYSPLAGTFTVGSAEYGNYRYSDGSIMVWVPAFFYRIGHVDNPTYATYGVNSIDVKPYSEFASVAAANAAGYALDRAFIDGGEIVPGFMRDKYHCSNNGGIASSIALGNPLSSNAAHNPFSLVGGANDYGGAIGAAKSRGAQFFPESVFMAQALALLSLAHGQAATSSANCAWYDAAGIINFPKGNNNNALRDFNDTSVQFTGDGYPNAAKTGSGAPFAKTTHNGQACGIADVNGNMWRINLGMTCIATSKAITNATQTNPVQLTVVGHGLTTGDQLQIDSVGGMTQINGRIYTITVVDADNLLLDGVDGTGFGAYTSGGTVTTGTFYVAKESTRMEDFTAGNTLASDHWGATGVAAMMDPIAVPFRTDYSNNAYAQRVGNGANEVFDPAVSGDGYIRTALGVPNSDGISPAGTSLFGQDYFYQFFRNELCVLSGGRWISVSSAGAFSLLLSDFRSSSYDGVGLVSASYPVRPSE